MAYPPTLGVVLAGGRAHRMGGGDKARIRVGGATILDRVLARLRPQCRGLILSANADAARFADTGLPVVTDSVPDHAGPLAGILAGLDWAADNAPGTAWIVSAPNDCPFLPRDLLARLHQARVEAAALLSCAQSGEQRHPVIALWPLALRDELRRALRDEGVRKVDQWTARYAVGVAAWPFAPVDPFFNVNTPEQAAEAERLAALHPEI
ncbi:MAG TPA: molybdenum cofactor guanylyltransferase MobA [Xanthobacteraceae bacterium]|nr:molybdenum cofactor guanylyltransferase MobA [Xanthobacteraceae bacterium]